jgi:hypothetical protein
MNTDSQSLSDVLRQLLKRVSALTDAELQDLLNGTATLEIRVKRRRGKGSAVKPRRSEMLPEDVVRRLRATRSRDAGMSFLEELNVAKVDLERIARCLDLPVQRSVTTERLKSNIVEATIGYRLRSEAIHGREPAQLPLDEHVRSAEVVIDQSPVKPIDE